jgi:circadian clock protein KaiB
MAASYNPKRADERPAFLDGAFVAPESEHLVLKLYVTGATGRSLRAIENIKAVCEKFLKDHYELEIVDLYQRPEQAKEAEVVAAPTLVKQHPLPVRRFIGDMSNTDKLLTGLNVQDETQP